MFDPNNPIPSWSVSTMQRVAEQATLAEAAVRYANLGIPIFPCAPGGKQPLTPNGFHDATSDARRVRAWWRRHPEANIGLPTGVRTEIVVVDVDVHGEASGFEAFERARGRGLAEGWGWLVRTPSGGLHAYYPVEPGVEQRCWQVPLAHIDFRGDGGYIIAPPSRVPTADGHRAYAVIAVATHRTRAIDADGLRRFLEPPRHRPPLPAPAIGPDGAPRHGCDPEALARTVAEAPEGGRNRTLFWASCRMLESNHSPDSVMSYLMPAAQHAGLPDREIETTIHSAFRSATPPASSSRSVPTQATDGIRL